MDFASESHEVTPPPTRFPFTHACHAFTISSLTSCLIAGYLGAPPEGARRLWGPSDEIVLWGFREDGPVGPTDDEGEAEGLTHS